MKPAPGTGACRSGGATTRCPPSSAVAVALRADRRLLPVIAPWVLDLARGLQYQSAMAVPNRAPPAC